MKEAVAKRVGGDVSLNYRDNWLVFPWDFETLYLATDEDGEVWAYIEEPVLGEDMFASDEYADHVHNLNRQVPGWQHTLVKFNIK